MIGDPTVFATLVAAMIAAPVVSQAEEFAHGFRGAKTGVIAQTQLVEATELRFEESEQGIEPYNSRLLVSSEYLRMDDGRDGGDYLLYDRRKRHIHSVSRQDRSILFISYRDIDIKPPIVLDLDLARSHDEQAPLVSGLPSENIVLSVNGKQCHTVVAVAGLLPEVNQALREYRLTLAGEQAANLPKTPAEFQSHCMLAEMIFAPTRHLDYGFPILEWDYRGYRRALIDFKKSVHVDSKLFQLPSGFRIFSINSLESE